jgi:hypothetical protein
MTWLEDGGCFPHLCCWKRCHWDEGGRLSPGGPRSSAIEGSAHQPGSLEMPSVSLIIENNKRMGLHASPAPLAVCR